MDPDAKKTLKLLDFGSLSKLQATQQRTVGMNLELFEVFCCAEIFSLNIGPPQKKNSQGDFFFLIEA